MKPHPFSLQNEAVDFVFYSTWQSYRTLKLEKSELEKSELEKSALLGKPIVSYSKGVFNATL